MLVSHQVHRATDSSQDGWLAGHLSIINLLFFDRLHTYFDHYWRAVLLILFSLRPVRLAYKLYFFSQRTVFFSHNKSANSIFSHANRALVIPPRKSIQYSQFSLPFSKRQCGSKISLFYNLKVEQFKGGDFWRATKMLKQSKNLPSSQQFLVTRVS